MNLHNPVFVKLSLIGLMALLSSCSGASDNDMHVADSATTSVASCDNGTSVPFTTFGPEKSSLILTDRRQVCLDVAGQRLTFGRDIPVFESITSDEDRVYYTREPYMSYLAVYGYDGSELAPVPLTDAQREALHVEHAFGLGDRHVFIAYNVETSIPSGRRFGSLSEGLSAWVVTSDMSGIRQIESVEMAGGIEANLHSVDHQGGRLVCQNLICFQFGIDATGAVSATPVALAFDAGGFIPQLTELASDGETAFALIERDYDDRITPRPEEGTAIFSLCPVDASGDCTPFPQDTTPYQLSVTDGSPTIHFAATPAESAQMLRHDLTRLRQTGVSNLGENNLEGRIAWGSVYYLNGLITLASDAPDMGGDFATLRQDAQTRLTLELDLLADQFGQETPRMAVKRYSVERRPFNSLLHLARIGRVLFRAEQAGLYAIENRSALIDEMLPRPGLLEVLVRGESGSELQFRKGAPFWADGSNVPWNFQSGWSEGLAFIHRADPDKAAAYAADVNHMIQWFLSDTQMDQSPPYWDYSGGIFQEGWSATDDISTNTPDYPGNKTNTSAAHISYRTMDVMGAVEAHKAGLADFDLALINHFDWLVDEGWIYPFAMEALASEGVAINMTSPLRQGYRRFALAYEFQAAPWVMTDHGYED